MSEANFLGRIVFRQRLENLLCQSIQLEQSGCACNFWNAIEFEQPDSKNFGRGSTASQPHLLPRVISAGFFVRSESHAIHVESALLLHRLQAQVIKYLAFQQYDFARFRVHMFVVAGLGTLRCGESTSDCFINSIRLSLREFLRRQYCWQPLRRKHRRPPLVRRETG